MSTTVGLEAEAAPDAGGAAEMGGLSPLPLPRLRGAGAYRRPQGWRIGPETHDCYEVAYLRAGLGTVEVDGAVHTASRGTLVLLAPGVPHRGSANPYARTEPVYVHVTWPQALLDRYGHWVPRQAVLRLEPHAQAAAHGIFERILAEADGGRLGWPLALAAALLDLFAFVVRTGRRLSAREGQAGAAPEGKAGPVHQAGEYVHAHFAEPLSVAAVARAAGYHPDYLTRVFRRETGVPLVQYIAHVRLEHAARLLTETQLPVGIVAERSGFTSTQYFCRAFRRRKGCTPGEYRRSATRRA